MQTLSVAKKSLFNDKFHSYEYVIALQPPHHILNEIGLLRDYFNLKIGYTKRKNIIPYISLCSFQLNADREEILLYQLNNFSQSHKPFEINIKGIRHNEKSKSNYVNLSNKKHLKSLHFELINRLIFTVRAPKKQLPYNLIPHIPINRKLNDKDFEISKKYFANKNYDSSFIANNIVLFKRYNDGKLKILNKFTFSRESKNKHSHTLRSIPLLKTA
jgi:hypothetical protein